MGKGVTSAKLTAAGLAAAGLGTAFWLRSEYEKDCLSVETVPVSSLKIQSRKKLFFLSDLHNKEFGPENQRLLSAINQVKPDAVLIGGDMMVSKGNALTEVPLRLIQTLSKRYPVYYGNGNHENRMVWERHIYKNQYESYRDQLKAMGVVYLEDDSSIFGDDLVISGVDQEKSITASFFLKSRSLFQNLFPEPAGKS